MCLLIHKPAAVQFTTEELTDFYTRNSDGYGVMYAEAGLLHYAKEIGDLAAWLAFYAKHAHREMCIHLRMRTHGEIDLENCHPYPVMGFKGSPKSTMSLALMHNGILSTGNAADTKRSDTWHYIRDYLRVILKAEPEFSRTPQFRSLIGAHIGGNNRFALMDDSGHVTIVNKSTGVEYKGAWFSNTYAWSASKFMPPPPAYKYQQQHQLGLTQAAYLDDWKRRTKVAPVWSGDRTTKGKAAKVAKKTKAPVQPAVTPDIAPTDRDIVSQYWVDDVTELRALLDEAHPDNTTRNRQIESMLKQVGASAMFEVIENMLDGCVTPQQWDTCVASPLDLRLMTSDLRYATQQIMGDLDEPVTFN